MTTTSRADLVAPRSLAPAAQSAAGLPAACRLSLVTGTAQLRALAQDWQSLEAENQTATIVFSSFGWCMAWAETYCNGAGDCGSLYVLAGHDEDRLVFLFPLMTKHKLGLNVLTWLSEPFGQYGDVLCAKDHSARIWIKASIEFLQRLKGVDLLQLRHVRADSLIAKYGTDQLVDARVPEEAPFLDLSAFKSEADYNARYTGAQRKRRKKIRKALEDMGRLEFTKLPVGSLADNAMQNALREKNKWLAERGRMNRVLACPLHLSFLKALSRQYSPVSVVVTELKAGSEAVSWEIGFRFGATHFAYVTSHVNALTDWSPGRLHMDYSQRQCLRDGMATFDLMVPNDAHKETWSSGKVLTNDMFLPLSATGAIFGHVYLRTLRPIIRSLYYWLEPNALRWFSLVKPHRS